MLDLSWTEIALVAVVAIVIIGPKDLPEAVRGVAKGIQKLRRMAGEFQGHVDDMVREAKLEEVRDQINQIRNFDIKGEIERSVDADGSIRKTFEDDPFRDRPAAAAPGAAPAGAAVAEAPGAAPDRGAPPGGMAETFGPPPSAAASPPPPAAPAPPAFIPPEVARSAEAAKPASASSSS